MPMRSLSLVAWGTADDISGASYSNIGTVSVTSGVTDPFGGTGAYTLNDTDGAAISGRRHALFTVGSTSLVFAFCVKQGTSSQFRVDISDSTAGAGRNTIIGAWSGGVPAVTDSVGTILTPSGIALGNGWYLVISTATTVSGNSHRFDLYPASTNTAATGTTSFYVRNVVLLDLIGSPKAYSEPAQGYEVAIAPSGTRDAWKVKAPDECLAGRVSWVPTAPRSFPQIVSGWDGANESTAVNCGVKAMLEAGWDMNLLRFVPDRSTCTAYNDAYLVEPAQGWQPELEGNADRAFAFKLVSATPFTGI